ncbi:LacI family DNA-binding transcriptional regulator [Actinopolymorpha alba]|uniref:LacI family DNA-binding transcriptional regulator n=1 Tax=Actinopolymorpha alba TaxID=533267 RepID=UPI001ED9AEEC|nr:LacI family DNA-binding transcriptional regulator [Actinopolymorpha alba]
MHDVARHAGVSQRTVSNVVNGYAHVAPATRARVQASIEALHYRPNPIARRLRRGRTSTVTLALPSLHERYFADLAAAVVAEARLRELKVLVETTEGDREVELRILRGGDLLTDGVIMSAVALTAEDEKIRHPDYPLVLVGDRQLRSQIDHVGADNRRAAREAVLHLLDTGRRRIALLGVGHGPTRTFNLRRRGYTDALTRYKLPVDERLLIDSTWTRAGGEAAIARHLASDSPPFDAVFAMNDSAAFGAMRAVLRSGLKVPADVAIVGFDNIDEAHSSVPSLTSVGPAYADIARAALDLLQVQADSQGERQPEQRRVPFELHVRESSTPPSRKSRA